MPLRKKLKCESQKTAHAGSVKLIYHMLALFKVAFVLVAFVAFVFVAFVPVFGTYSGAIHQKLSYERSIFMGECFHIAFF